MAVNYRYPFRLYCFVSWTMRLRTFAGRFYTRNKRPLNVCMTVLRRVQKGFEHVHAGFASCTKRPWTFAWRFCAVYKRSLNVCMAVLHVCKKGLKLVQGVFARVQKGLERCKNGLVQWTIWAWSCFKSFLRRVQFGHELTSRWFCSLSLKSADPCLSGAPW